MARMQAVPRTPLIVAVIAVLVALAMPLRGTLNAQTPPTPDIQTLMAQLTDVRTIRRDTDSQILQLARKDSEARKYVVHMLPEMIKASTDESWLNAVRLAGDLKAVEAIPALQAAMSRRPFPAEGYITFTRAMHLDNDIVAKALSRIGEPAIPSVVNLLESLDALMRSRAVLILANMDSRAARNALKYRPPHETDPEIKALIEDSLSSDFTKH
jgi:HEAT repeat protein